LGIGDWGLGIGPNPQSPIPNPQSPKNFLLIFKLYNINNNIIYIYFKKIKLNLYIFIYHAFIYNSKIHKLHIINRKKLTIKKIYPYSLFLNLLLSSLILGKFSFKFNSSLLISSINFLESKAVAFCFELLYIVIKLVFVLLI